MIVTKFVTQLKKTNIYLYYDFKTKRGVIIDPGDDIKLIIDLLEETHIQLDAIIITHGHYDHILDVEEIKEYSKAKVYAMKSEKQLLSSPKLNLSYKVVYEKFNKSALTIKPDIFLEDGDEIELGNSTLKVIHTPGHTEGSCCLYDEKHKVIFTGDTLFKGNIGKSNLPTGNLEDLLKSIKEKLFLLPDDVVVYPGHYEKTTIGDEKRENRVLRLLEEN